MSVRLIVLLMALLLMIVTILVCISVPLILITIWKMISVCRTVPMGPMLMLHPGLGNVRVCVRKDCMAILFQADAYLNVCQATMHSMILTSVYTIAPMAMLTTKSTYAF